ncbi:hypothetical protein [Bifidobacterium stellenboschense]|uniref:Uncharacterized protein n=1 Tax=Bifidobacterium stellenboschense TaxID=762211 RepID=A0A087DR37_9BIFI|nr:hypothetical protein [Bifidobacterium stellenboschense]KFI97987.1 hypothetical protein BSTEL_0747 [Bifidobacterium stellenboschense]
MTDEKTLDKTTNIRTMDTQAMPAEQSAEQAVADKGFDDSRNHSLQDIVDTQAMPAPADVKPDIAPPTEQVLDKPLPAVDLNTPLNRLMGVADDEPEPEPKQPEPKPESMPQNPTVAPTSAQSAAPAPAAIAPSGPSVPTILLGVVGILVGAFGLLLGLRLPDVTVWMLGIDPQTLTALFFGGIGVVLILVAVIWAIAKAVAGRRKQ